MAQHAAGSARLFLALLPDSDVRTALGRHRDQWRWAGDERRYAPQDWHVTLHFIGAVAQDRIDALRKGLDVPMHAFALALGQPQLWRGGLAVLCPLAVPEPLQRLHADLAHALHGLGLPTDARPFAPHVTLARRAPNAQPPTAVPAIAWPVAGYALMASTGDATRRYRVVQAYAAKGMPPPDGPTPSTT